MIPLRGAGRDYQLAEEAIGTNVSAAYYPAAAFKDGPSYIAMCFSVDVMAQGKTVNQAWERLEIVLKLKGRNGLRLPKPPEKLCELAQKNAKKQGVIRIEFGS